MIGLCLALVGCTAPQPAACGFALTPDQFSIAVTSGTSHDPAIALCIDGTCSRPVPDAHHKASLVAGNTTASSRASLSAVRPGLWQVLIRSEPRPTSITIHIDPGSTPTVTRTVRLSWHRGNPSDTCHPWHTVDTVRLAVP